MIAGLALRRGLLVHLASCVRWLERVRTLAWRRLREWTGDLAYETYASRSRDSPRLSRRAFYLASLQQRYSRPNRCC
jgi:hypothetical protein